MNFYCNWHIEAQQLLSSYGASLTAPDGDTYVTRVPCSTCEETAQDTQSLVWWEEASEREVGRTGP